MSKSDENRVIGANKEMKYRDIRVTIYPSTRASYETRENALAYVMNSENGWYDRRGSVCVCNDYYYNGKIRSAARTRPTNARKWSGRGWISPLRRRRFRIAVSDAAHISLIVEVSEAVAGVARTYRASAMCLRMRRWRAGDLGPAHFEETAHPVAGLAHRTVVLVEYLAVDEHLPDIGAKLIARLVPASRSTRCEKSLQPSNADQGWRLVNRLFFFFFFAISLCVHVRSIRPVLKTKRFWERKAAKDSTFT